MTEQDAQKAAAAAAAVALIEDGMAVGLGTGSTAALMIDLLAARVRDGLRIVAVPTSERSAAQARAGGIPLADLGEHPRLDLTIDGADQVSSGRLDLIKGMGGALLREKIVADSSDRLVIIVDATKLAPALDLPVPVEVVAFGWRATARKIAALGAAARRREDAEGRPVQTDGGNMILDCALGRIADPAATERALRDIVGVIETGLFVGRADTVLVAGSGGVTVMERSAA